MKVNFTIPGRISGKGRPRFFRKGEHVGVYTPAKTRNCEALVRAMASEAMRGAPPMEGPLWLGLHIRLIPPKSWPKRKRAGAMFATGKPDMDNLLKLIGDALNGIVWIDDSQVAAGSFVRTFDCNQPEAVTVSVHELTDPVAVAEQPIWCPPTAPISLFDQVGATI